MSTKIEKKQELRVNEVNPIREKYKFINPDKIITDSSIMYRTLDIDGNLINPKYQRTLTDDQLKKAYDFMVLSRQQDTYMSQLQRQGRMLTFPPNIGEEALQIATGLAMKKGDWFVPAFRSNALMLFLGVPLINQMRYWNGQEDGSKMPEGVNVLPINITIGTQYSQCAGIAFSLKSQGKKNVAVTFIGDGGTSEGEFYESMNLAAVRNWPAVFCINNNKWSISTPLSKATKTPTLSQKAVAVNIPSLRVDGNDLLASFDVIQQAIEYARDGGGPILVEFVSWRQGVHTSSDNPKIYRTLEAEKENEKWEPFHRIEKYLVDQKIYTPKDFERIKEEKLEIVKKAFQESLIGIETKLDDIFDYTYANLSPELAEQKADAKKYWTKDKVTWTDKEVL